MVLNGALAGLVSITAEPLTPTLGVATLIGGFGGIIVVFAVPLLDKLKIDDVVGAIPCTLNRRYLGHAGGGYHQCRCLYRGSNHRDCCGWSVYLYRVLYRLDNPESGDGYPGF